MQRLARIAGRPIAETRSLGVTDRQAEIRRILDKHRGNRAAAARELGISRQTLIVSLKRSARAA